MTDPIVLTAVYTREPDEIFEFHADGQARTFGRDDTRCDIVIWSAINGTDLSRTAGRLWRLDDELWVRNLSTRHELAIAAPGQPATELLPMRRENGVDRGPARSLPAPLAYVRGPGGCELEIRQQRGLRTDAVIASSQEPTTRLPTLADLNSRDTPLGATAVALCRPLFDGALLPAPYRDVMRELGNPSHKGVRTLVTSLCAVYEKADPAARRRADTAAHAALDIPTAPTPGPGATLRFDHVPAADAESQPRKPSVPNSYWVAHLLVRHRIVTPDDL